ncbi:MAG TPA: squalene/phytoene synthase family protein [Limnobacter sp.]|nr:squalene/phytoene synthase family protein [Limnobacter sp.]
MTVSLENPLAYCQEKVGGETASLHYATLFQTEELKAFWLGCFTLNHELRQACLKQLEAGLTQVKLGWWKNALVQVEGQTNAHPVIIAISRPVLGKIPVDHWPGLINTVASGCEPKRFNSMADWEADVRAQIAPWGPLVEARMENAGNLDSMLQFWTRATQLCQVLRLAKYLDQGFQPLPINLLREHNITAEQVKRREHSEASQRMFQATCDGLVESANAAWKAMPTEQRLFARPLRALFRMRVAEWHIHKASGCKLLTEEKIITPFKKFSISWTTQVFRR